jgi:ketosteroid isomerase-like protein
MSQENVEAIRRAAEAYNRGDVDAVLRELDPKVEWHPLLQVLLGGEATVYRGHEGVPELYRDIEEAFTEAQVRIVEIRDLGERAVAIGYLSGRGRGSGAKTETVIAWVADFKDGKAIRIREYLDPDAALEAAELSE